MLILFCAGTRGHAGERAAATSSSLAISELRCEYMIDPMGSDNPHPRFFWKLQSGERGQRQSAFQILVDSSRTYLEQGRSDCWDSGKVRGDSSVFVPYAGRKLLSGNQYWWKVKVWDAQGVPSMWSASAHFDTGIFSAKEWHGEWIASDLDLKDYQKELRALPDFGMQPESEIWKEATRIHELTKNVPEAPAVYMRREFKAKRTVRRAMAYVSGLGMYELYINGQKSGDQYLNPAYSDYDKTVYYLAHDVTNQIKAGDNALGVILGNGWYNLITPHALRFYAADYIAPPCLRLRLDIEYEDGTRDRIVSDKSWQFTTDGPIRFNCVLGGETHDARKNMPGWDMPNYDASHWKSVRTAKGPKGKLTAQLLPPVTLERLVPATTVTKVNGKYKFDIGFETTGWARLNIRGKPGQKITVHYPGSGSHTLGRYQTCKFICSGNGQETFQSRFSYNGFRYIEVAGLDYEPDLSDIQAMPVHTVLEQAGSFSCSDERLNALQEILLRTVRNYIVHLPNDPTREKAGWTQDVESNFPEMAYNYLAAPTFCKWQQDFLDAIKPNGYVPPVVPSRFDGPTINCPWWGGAIIYGPWYLYQFYGDKDILIQSYPAMKKQFQYLDSIAKNNIIEWGLGDWMEVGSVRPVRTPVPQTSTCAFYYFAEILSKTAHLMDKPREAHEFAQKAKQIRTAYNKQFLNAETGEYAKGSQTSQLISLIFGLAPPDRRELILKAFADRIEKDKRHLTTGFIGTPLLLTGLCDLGRADLAWSIATQTDYPSFIDAILNRGQTVMKEDWNGGLVQMPSLQGPIGTWFFHGLAGIRTDPDRAGFKHVILKPEITGNLTWVKARHETLFGPVESNWQHTNGKFTWQIRIPPNVTASVYVPAEDLDSITESGKALGDVRELKVTERGAGYVKLAIQSGRYEFTSAVD